MVIMLSNLLILNQLVDLFTEPLNKERFNIIRNELGIIDFKNI